LLKDLPLKGPSQGLKGGTKSKPIRLVEGDHKISGKLDGMRLQRSHAHRLWALKEG